MCVLLDLVLLAIATSVMSPSLTVPSPKPYVELGSPLVQMPSVNLGTCCGSDPTVMSVKRHDDQTIEYCLKNNITYEAFGVMRGCPFTDQHVNSIAQKHAVSTAQVCIRWVLQRGAIAALGTGSDASTVEDYTKENLDVWSFELSDQEMATLNGLGQ
jgi:diketogulonate reductase-like aldo/keto reductase